MTDVLPSIVCLRKLRDPTSGVCVELVVRQPIVDAEDPNGDWVCTVEIRTGDDDVQTFKGHGVDSMQCLIQGIATLRAMLLQRSNLEWLGAPGDVGLPLMIHDPDPDFLALVGQLISAERSRQILTLKALKKKE